MKNLLLQPGDVCKSKIRIFHTLLTPVIWPWLLVTSRYVPDVTTLQNCPAEYGRFCAPWLRSKCVIDLVLQIEAEIRRVYWPRPRRQFSPSPSTRSPLCYPSRSMAFAYRVPGRKHR